MKTAVLFSGQGAQKSGMALDFYNLSRLARSVFEVADTSLNRPISKLCFEGSQAELNLTHNTQPCMLAADLASYYAVLETSFHVDAVAGFSLGEYAALVAAGVLPIEDAFRIIQIRADAMQKAVPAGEGAMVAATKTSVEIITEMCCAVEGYIVPANYNAPDQTVVSGEKKAVESFLKLAKEKKIRTVKLPVSAPFHCKLMEPAKETLEKEFALLHFAAAKIPIYMNVDGSVHTQGNDVEQCILSQTVSSIHWVQTIHRMYDDGIRNFVECGPGGTLTKLCTKILCDKEDIRIVNIEKVEDLDKIHDIGRM